MLWAVVLLKFVTPPVVCWPGNVERFSLQLQVDRDSARECRTDAHSTIAREPTFLRARLKRDIQTRTRRPAKAFDGGRAEAAGQARFTREFEIVGRALLVVLAGAWLLGFDDQHSEAGSPHQSSRLAHSTREGEHPISSRAKSMRSRSQVGLRPPRAVVTEGIDSPFVWFIGRLRLVWPEKLTGFDQIVRSRSVIAHELAHVRRGDHILAWVELLAALVWWWNPLFWFVRSRVRASAELACDAIALSTCSESRRSYAELLLRLSSGSGMETLAPVLGIKAGSTALFRKETVHDSL